MGNRKLNVYLDVENHKFDSLFTSIYGTGYSMLKTGFNFKNKHFNAGFSQHFLLAHTNSTKWDALFRSFDIERLPYVEYPLIGYKQYITMYARTSVKLLKIVNLSLSLQTARYAINQPPRSDEILMQTTIPVKRFRLYYDMRYYHIKSSYLKIDRDFLDNYIELSYKVSRNLSIKGGYGFYPYNLIDEHTARREYLLTNGINLTQLKNNFRSLGQILEEAESNIRNTKELRLWLELYF